MMAQTRTANPVLVLEEVEKAGGSGHNGVAHSVLLTMVERETAREYWDKCLLAKVDLSNICWVMTCNNPGLLPPMLLSRLDVIEVAGPSADDFAILLASMTFDLARAWAVPIAAMPTLPKPAVSALEKAFAVSQSARALQRHLEIVFATLVQTTPRPTQ
jgi:ATP-dependent Lon protease